MTATKEPEKSDIDKFIEEHKHELEALKSTHGELVILESAWGGIFVFKKPSWEAQIKYNADLRDPSNVQRAWADIKFLQMCCVLPEGQEFTETVKKLGYDAVTNLRVDMENFHFTPKVKPDAKKF